jgi:hypothetical protein
MYQIVTKLPKRPLDIPNGRHIFQMAMAYANLFHSKAVQNLPESRFLVCQRQTVLRILFQRYRRLAVTVIVLRRLAFFSFRSL